MRIIPCVLLCLAACGGDDASSAPDAPAPPPDAQDTARCLVPEAFGALGALTGTAGSMGGVTATMTLDAGPPRDTLFVKLVTGKGVFASGIAPGTYTIGGVDADYVDCGLCVHVIADIVAGSGPSKFYFAQSGSVTLTTTAAPITGSAQDLVLREVDIATGDVVTGGCQTTIDAVSFTAN